MLLFLKIIVIDSLFTNESKDFKCLKLLIHLIVLKSMFIVEILLR